MGAYLPREFPGEKLTLGASATVTGGQLLAVSGDKTVAPTGGATSAWIGVAANDATSGQNVTVFCVGVHLLTASGSIAAGDRVIAAAAGKVATVGADATPGHLVGKALAAATDGNPVLVRLGL